MTDEERRRLAQEKDSFVKTALVAFVANYFSLNRNVPLNEIAPKALAMAEETWAVLHAWRQRNSSQ